MIDKCGECILADFQHYYRTDLRDVLTPGSGLTSRRAIALIRQLPPESATTAALRGGSEFRGWGQDRYLLAAMIDAIKENTHAFISANSKKKPKTPKPVDRPDFRAEKKQKGNSFAAIAGARLAAMKKRKEGNDG